jgi:predicted nucleic acid-binding protein
MNVVDSSAWLEYFAGGPNARHFAAAIENTEELIVPALTLYEVFKRILQQAGETPALTGVTAMQQGQVVDLDAALAIGAAKLGADLGLPLAHSIILATARRHGAVLWTQDGDFEGLDGVEYRAGKVSG